MPSSRRPAFVPRNLFVVLLAWLTLASCGGGGDSRSGTSSAAGSVSTTTSGNSALTQSLAAEPSAPQSAGDTATDGFNWFNYRRQQAGLSAVSRTVLIDKAAQAHSNYEKLNDTITHTETQGLPGFTGADVDDRLKAAGYSFSQSRFSFGEVLSATGDPSGFGAAEDLIGAIYHRFVILEPTFREAGTGSATVPGGYTYFTANFTANGVNAGLGRGNMATYPASGQLRVPTVFFSDRETPDPVSGQNEVGYPVSVHADITSTLTVQSFTIAPRGGATLAVKLLTHTNDAETPTSAAAIVPLATLSAQTTYDVQFNGLLDGAPIVRNWSFTTR